MRIRENLRHIRQGASRGSTLLLEKARIFSTRALAEENEGYMAAVAYIPFIGWLFPLYLKPESEFSQDHGKTGLLLTVFFTALVLALYFINLLITPRDWREVRFGLVILIYLSYGVYVSLCCYGGYRAVKRKKLENRWISRYKNVIPL